MEKPAAVKKRLLKEANDQLKKLRAQMVVAKKAEGIDDYITVKLKKSTARYDVTRKRGEPDKGAGKFFLQINIITKKEAVFIPLSIASGKTVTGFMYQIEGTGEGLITTAEVDCRGEGVTQVTIGTLLFAKLPPGATGEFRIQVTTRGQKGKTYKVTINRINYKLTIADARYQQYIKPIVSDQVKFS
ncbi:hypothetical protein K2Q16_01495 [Patescibacteria group bacterium]|nr:hypothetical protein [Patescibacteria group bacterium]